MKEMIREWDYNNDTKGGYVSTRLYANLMQYQDDNLLKLLKNYDKKSEPHSSMIIKGGEKAIVDICNQVGIPALLGMCYIETIWKLMTTMEYIHYRQKIKGIEPDTNFINKKYPVIIDELTILNWEEQYKVTAVEDLKYIKLSEFVGCDKLEKQVIKKIEKQEKTGKGSIKYKRVDNEIYIVTNPIEKVHVDLQKEVEELIKYCKDKGISLYVNCGQYLKQDVSNNIKELIQSVSYSLGDKTSFTANYELNYAICNAREILFK